MSYGIVHTIISIIILGIDVLLKEKIGYGTILDALLVGNYVDLIDHIITLPDFNSIPISATSLNWTIKAISKHLPTVALLPSKEFLPPVMSKIRCFVKP